MNEDLENKIDYIISYYNPCRIDGSSCLVSKQNPCCYHTRFKQNGLCPYMIDNQCTNPNLECKLWFCKTCIDNMDSECFKSIIVLESIAREYNLISRPFIGDPYVGADKPRKEMA